MKTKLFVIAIALLAIFLLPAAAFAQEIQTEDSEIVVEDEPADVDLPDAGTTPDSAFYGIDVALDNLRYNMAAKGETKARIGLEIAEERLSEIQVMGKQNKGDAAEKAQERHQEMLNKVKDDVEDIDGAPGDITGIEQGMANHIAAMEKVMAKVQANENIPEATRTKLMEKFQNQISNANELKLKIQNKGEQLELKQQEREREETQKGNESGEVEREQEREEKGGSESEDEDELEIEVEDDSSGNGAGNGN